METPILFLVFNRPDTTQRVFDEIRNAKPKYLFIAADGPRINNDNDRLRCGEVRSIVKNIDWDCEVKTLFREENLGCKLAISSAITWFFDNVEMGIILEDDCLPNKSFFSFCSKLLLRYKNDNQVMMISGTHHLKNLEIHDDYFFSNHFQIWGWATWKRAWDLYDIEMKEWPILIKEGSFEDVYKDRKIYQYYKDSFNHAYHNLVNTWDIQWNYTCVLNKGLSITPKHNLVTNIGVQGTHTTTKTIEDQNLFRKTQEIELSDMLLEKIEANHYLDRVQFNNFYKANMLERLYSNLLYRIRLLKRKLNNN
ncbi:MAG: hypothetical protein WC087_01390 [Candidatus Paceibacterota bacterium]